ncbi:hypothetical protein D3C76_957310 [compost metagenome]
MAEAGDQGQRHRVGDFRADQALGGEERIEHEQRDGAQCAGADGGQRDHGAKHHAGGHGQRIQAAAAEVVVVARMLLGEGHQLLLEQDGQGGQQQDETQRVLDDGVGRLDVGIEALQEQQGQRGGRHAAEGQPAGDLPVDVVVLLVHQHATGLGDGGIQQVGADRGRGVDAEPQQNWRHQGAAANAGHADDEADDQARNDKTSHAKFHSLFL